MPRVEFGAENKVVTTNYDYPKLKLKKGESARVLVGLEDPLVEFVHTLRKPQIINGVPQITTAERRDGTTYDAYKLDFVSKPLCLGDATVLAEKGSDPKNCPACKLAKDFPDYAKEPQRRYAMHVIRYRTKAGGTEVATPFSVDLVVWSFTDQIFNRITDLKEEWGDLRKHDLLLGPCTEETFQKFDISIAQRAEWLVDEERKKITALTFRENQIPDLTIACGSVKQRQWVEQDVQTIMAEWAKVHGAEAAAEAAGGSNLSDDLNDLLSGSAPAVTNSSKESVTVRPEDVDMNTGELLNEKPEVTSSDDLLAGLGDLNVDPSVPEEAPTAETTENASGAAAVDNFDDLLAGL